MDDLIINKLSTIKRCLQRINEEYDDEASFKSNFTKQDSVILNLQRACEASIDICNHLIKKQSLGIPQSARDSFELVAKAGIISDVNRDQLKNMVGLRNIAVHDDQALNIDIVISVVNHHLKDFEMFSTSIVRNT
ncbi:MAG: DUF86 domain-containing protein [Oleispira sp.]|nr:DUF86 domain-containing protein [Oleispira sp.]